MRKALSWLLYALLAVVMFRYAVHKGKSDDASS